METGDRYACQARLPVWGEDGQRRLAEATVVVVGVGATGAAMADALARAGVGTLRLVDRDVLELSNLHRQVLYDEQDLARGLPKAEAARLRLERVNSRISVEARVADLEATNVLALLAGATLVVDGTDNFRTRFVLNDACASLGIPWVYTGVVGTTVHGFPIVPNRGACFRCYLGALPPAGSVETCETAGVLGSAVLVAAGLGATEAVKLLLGREAEAVSDLFIVDVWTRESRRVRIPKDPACPTCQGRFEHLEQRGGSHAELCGQDAVALRAGPDQQGIDLPGLAQRLESAGAVSVANAFLLRFTPQDSPGVALTVFADGRALVKGTRDPAAARSLYARYVGA